MVIARVGLLTKILSIIGSADGVLCRGWACADLRVQPCECLALLGAAMSNWWNKLQNSPNVQY